MHAAAYLAESSFILKSMLEFIKGISLWLSASKVVAGTRRVPLIPLEVERRFSDPIRIESGCESSLKGENRRGETISHDP
jgi:hypothetical protein